jgi:predicted sugar kinase
MPALAEQDFASFSDAIGEIQRTVGDYFAVAQGGRFASPAVAEVLAWLEANGVAGVGQSSWGPTGFGVVDSELRAHALLVEARSRFAHLRQLELVVARGRNHGHDIEHLAGERAASGDLKVQQG